jgi:hypothetical protein
MGDPAYQRHCLRGVTLSTAWLQVISLTFRKRRLPQAIISSDDAMAGSVGSLRDVNVRYQKNAHCTIVPPLYTADTPERRQMQC